MRHNESLQNQPYVGAVSSAARRFRQLQYGRSRAKDGQTKDNIAHSDPKNKEDHDLDIYKTKADHVGISMSDDCTSEQDASDE